MSVQTLECSDNNNIDFMLTNCCNFMCRISCQNLRIHYYDYLKCNPSLTCAL